MGRYNEAVDATLEDGLRALREATERAADIRIEVTEDYLQLIAQVEAMPQNQSGADKSHVWPAQQAYLNCFRNARLLSHKP